MERGGERETERETAGGKKLRVVCAENTLFGLFFFFFFRGDPTALCQNEMSGARCKTRNS